MKDFLLEWLYNVVCVTFLLSVAALALAPPILVILFVDQWKWSAWWFFLLVAEIPIFTALHAPSEVDW